MPAPRTYRTSAIVLSRFDLGEADRVLTLLTPHDGKLKAIAKGVRRPGSRIGGSVEPFAELQLLLVRGSHLRRHHPGQVAEAWLRLRDRLTVDRHRVVPGRARGASRRGASRRLPGLRAAAARLPAARRRHGAGPGRTLVRARPGRRAGRCARRSTAASSATGCRRRPSASAGCPASVACCASGTPAPRRRCATLSLGGAQGAAGVSPAGHRGDRGAAAAAGRRDGGRAAHAPLHASRARARGTLAGVPRRGPGASGHR